MTPAEERTYERAMHDLMDGGAARFWQTGDGSFVRAFDRQYGLPIALAGDCGTDLACRVRGMNRATHAFVDRHGLPWNSRLRSLGVLADVEGSFRRRATEAFTLTPGGPPFEPESLGFAIRFDEQRRGRHFVLWSQTLVKFGGLHGPPSPDLARDSVPRPPSTAPGTRPVVLLGLRDAANRVECLAVGPGTHLVLLRFSGFMAPYSEIAEEFAVLDTQLGEVSFGLSVEDPPGG